MDKINITSYKSKLLLFRKHAGEHVHPQSTLPPTECTLPNDPYIVKNNIACPAWLDRSGVSSFHA